MCSAFVGQVGVDRRDYSQLYSVFELSNLCVVALTLTVAADLRQDLNDLPCARR